MKKRIWIVGGSSGIGLELVKLWLADGQMLIVSSRNTGASDELTALQKQYPSRLTLLDMDVTDVNSIQQTVPQAWECYHGIDLWFYNAGTYTSAAIDGWNLEKLELMNQTNYMGAVRMIQSLYPYFKRQQNGRWVFNASLSSYFGLPLGGGYSAPKAALVNLAQSLQPELLHAGIALQIINHGFVKTRLTQQNSFEMPQLMTANEAAQQIFMKLQAPYRFELRFPRRLGFILRLLSLLPVSWSLKLTQRIYHVS